MRLAGLTLLATLAAAAPAAAAGDLVAVDAGTGATRVLASGEDTYWQGRPCFTPDGAVVAAGSVRRGRFYFEHRADGSRRVLGRTGPANTIVLAPGCARVAEGRLALPGRPRGDTGLVVRTPASLRPVVQLRSYWPVEAAWMAWSNDGTRIADVDDSGRREAVRITDVTTGRTVARRTIRHESGSMWEGAFSPDGSRVVFSESDWHRTRGIVAHELTMFDAAGGTFRTLLRMPLRGLRGDIGAASWRPAATARSPSGRRTARTSRSARRGA